MLIERFDEKPVLGSACFVARPTYAMALFSLFTIGLGMAMLLTMVHGFWPWNEAPDRGYFWNLDPLPVWPIRFRRGQRPVPPREKLSMCCISVRPITASCLGKMGAVAPPRSPLSLQGQAFWIRSCGGSVRRR